MKTAISIPDETYERAERVRAKHRMRRSHFYAEAVARYADELESAEVTAAIDAVVDEANADESARSAVDVGFRTVGGIDEAW